MLYESAQKYYIRLVPSKPAPMRRFDPSPLAPLCAVRLPSQVQHFNAAGTGSNRTLPRTFTLVEQCCRQLFSIFQRVSARWHQKAWSTHRWVCTLALARRTVIVELAKIVAICTAAAHQRRHCAPLRAIAGAAGPIGMLLMLFWPVVAAVGEGLLGSSASMDTCDRGAIADASARGGGLRGRPCSSGRACHR